MTAVQRGSTADASYTSGTDREETGMTADDAVHLTMPALTRHLRLARLTAAGLAGDLGFDLEAIEDLRVAVDELCAAVIDEVPADSRLTLSYRTDGDTVRIDGEVDAGGPVPELHRVAEELLGIVADEFSVDGDDGRRWFRLVKRGQRLDGGG